MGAYRLTTSDFGIFPANYLMAVTKTLGPLHLEDLEPHRFEDLIRQLLYDFRKWRRLEPTGRGGSDDGFDVRAWETTRSDEDHDSEETESLHDGDDLDKADTVVPPASCDRVWLIQCKRERRISPAELRKYLRDIPAETMAGLHGLVFAAACDFSKKAHDAFRDTCRELGIAEWHLWGKSAIEDRLFLPANDHLLFAYFGVSLQIRKRSLKTSLRARLMIKRKATQLLSKKYDPIVLLDATDDRYPYLDADKTKDRAERGRWMIRSIDEIHHSAIGFVAQRQFAVLDENGAWDYAETMNDVKTNRRDPWRDAELSAQLENARIEQMAIWSEWPEDKRGWHETINVLPMENILAIDPDGYGRFPYPHIYTSEWHAIRGPFTGWFRRITPNVQRFDTIFVDDPEAKRLQVFARKAK